MTNPETCLHNVVEVRGTDKLVEIFVYCVSCGMDLSDIEKRVGKNYEYDVDYNVWVHKPKKEK